MGALLLAALLARPALGGAARTWLVAGALVVAVAPLALVGHASVQGALMTALAAVHVTTTAAWSGTVVAAAMLLPRAEHDTRVAVLRRTSWVGTATFFFALLTGLLMANTLVPSVAGLFGSVYGLGLVAKSLLVVPVLLIALAARTRLRRKRSTSVLAEAGLLLLIVVLGVFVASQPPPAAAKYQPTPTWRADTAPAAEQADDLLVSAQIDPNSPGTRFLVVKVDDTRRPSPGPITGVVASVGTSPLEPLERGDDGLWTGRIDVTDPGPTSIHVEVSRDDFPVAVANTTWTVAPTPGTLDGGAPLTGYIAVAIAGLVATTLLVLIVEGFTGRRRDDDEPSPDGPAAGEVPATVA
jgi:copper transport protein